MRRYRSSTCTSPSLDYKKPRQSRRRQPGQNLVEMALVIPILLLLIFGSIDAVQIAMTSYQLAQAAEVAAHEAALIGGAIKGEEHGNLEQVKGTIAEKARLVLETGLGTDAKNATISVTCEPAACTRYSAVTVEISYAAEVWVPIGPFDRISAVARATRATEQDRRTTAKDTPSINSGSSAAQVMEAGEQAVAGSKAGMGETRQGVPGASVRLPGRAP